MSVQRLSSKVIPVREVNAALRERLFALMQRCYDCISRDRFESDLAEKDYLIVLSDAAGVTRGFSTQKLFCGEWKGQSIQVLFSGDTVVEPAYWGSHELAKAWCQVAAMAMKAQPSRRLFWFLVSKGYRTYLYLPLFFKNYFPRHDIVEAPGLNELLITLAKERFGSAFDEKAGVLRFPESLGQLTPEFAQIPDARSDDPHVQYFLRKNPGFALGEELACLAEVSLENTHGLGQRWLEKAIGEVALHD